MRWLNFLIYYLRKNVNDPEFEPPNARAAFWNTIATGALDIFYLILAIFTYAYILASAILFFSRLDLRYPILSAIIDMLSEPYLGSVGIYVILKEVRKRRKKVISRHVGELFVGAWLILLFSALILTLVSPLFTYNEILRNIVVNSLVVLLIFIGSLISKP